MLKQIFIVLVLYCIAWWIMYSIYFKFANKNENKDYTKDGLYGFVASIIYFFIFTVIYVGVSNFNLSIFSISNLTGVGSSSSKNTLL